MTKIISLKKGLDIKLCGEIQTGQKAREVSHTAIAIVPDDFPGITPKAMVKPGDNVLRVHHFLLTKSIRISKLYHQSAEPLPMYAVANAENSFLYQ